MNPNFGWYAIISKIIIANTVKSIFLWKRTKLPFNYNLFVTWWQPIRKQKNKFIFINSTFDYKSEQFSHEALNRPLWWTCSFCWYFSQYLECIRPICGAKILSVLICKHFYTCKYQWSTIFAIICQTLLWTLIFSQTNVQFLGQHNFQKPRSN